MVHEPYLPFTRGAWRANVAAAGHRLMTMILLQAASRVWVATPAWARRWRQFTLGRKIEFRCIPIPSSIPVVHDPAAVSSVRARLAQDQGTLIGHFGTCRGEVAELLSQILAGALRADPLSTVVMIGRGSNEFRSDFGRAFPDLTDRIHATGGLPEHEISLHLSACDILVQPYPDGINSRQSSAMAGLAHGRAMVTTAGEHTEPIWASSGAVALAPVGNVLAAIAEIETLRAHRARRMEMGMAGQELYGSHFAIEAVLAALLLSE
jgi:hypothetical protein